MNMMLQFILWSSIGALAYTYVIFPWLIRRLAKGKSGNGIVLGQDDDLPRVSVLMSLYNEEKVIAEKLRSLVRQDYPKEKIRIHIGSDCSDDGTDGIVSSFAERHHHIRFTPFGQRRGKPGVVNRLYQEAVAEQGRGQGHIIIVTDASVVMDVCVVFELVKHFKNDKIGLVDSNIRHTGIAKGGISQSEDLYISNEVSIKHAESLANAKMMGPLGGCYAIRSDLFVPVPDTFLVDDFYLAMNVLDMGYDAINELQATCTEPVSQEISEEFRRKKRISAGNYQNLWVYKHLLFHRGGGTALNFWGHKFLRWKGPFLILASVSSNAVLSLTGNLFYIALLSFQAILVIIIPIMDALLAKLGVNIRIFRSIRYFFVMKVALLAGFFKYIKGINSNVWQPTQRPDSTEQHPRSHR